MADRVVLQGIEVTGHEIRIGFNSSTLTLKRRRIIDLWMSLKLQIVAGGSLCEDDENNH